MTTRDRAEVLHFAGRNRLSPALAPDGAPAFSEQGDGLARCGWARFFAALDARGLAVDVTDDAAQRFAPPGPVRHASLGEAIAHARRFVEALRRARPE